LFGRPARERDEAGVEGVIIGAADEVLTRVLKAPE
jgi:hypothetical protein